MSPKPMRVVFDTSVLVSVVGRPGSNYSTWSAVVNGEISAFTTERAIAELREVLLRPKLRQHYGVALDPVNVDLFIASYRAMVTVMDEPAERFVLRADPKDSPFLNLAIAVGAHYLVTFDEIHVLALNDPHHPQYSEIRELVDGLAIVKPAVLSAELRRLREASK